MPLTKNSHLIHLFILFFNLAKLLLSYLLLILELDLEKWLMRLAREHQVVLVVVEAVRGADEYRMKYCSNYPLGTIFKGMCQKCP
jgi:hypothetical protein